MILKMWIFLTALFFVLPVAGWSEALRTLDGPGYEAALHFLRASKCSYVHHSGEIIPNPSGTSPGRLPLTEVREKGKPGAITYVVRGGVDIWDYLKNPEMKIPRQKESPARPMIYPAPGVLCGTKAPKLYLCSGQVKCANDGLDITADVLCYSKNANQCPDAKTCALQSKFPLAIKVDQPAQVFLSQKRIHGGPKFDTSSDGAQ